MCDYYWDHDEYKQAMNDAIFEEPVLQPLIIEKPNSALERPLTRRKHGALHELQQKCLDRPKYLVCGKCTNTCQCK
jgi:hypothetical protein